MSCWQRPEWTEFFQCVYDQLAKPVYLTLPWGVWLLISFVIGLVLSVLYFSVTDMIFGRYASLKPFHWVGERIGDAAWHTGEFARRLCRRYQGAVGREAEEIRERAALTDTPGEDRIDPDAAEKAPSGRRQKGD